MRKLKVYCGQQETDLGILVPVEDGFGLECRIPRKRLGEGEYRFAVLPRHGKSSGKFIPVYPEEPFAYISRLKHAHMARRNGQAGIILPDETGRFLYP